jgi:hypothetical protein
MESLGGAVADYWFFRQSGHFIKMTLPFMKQPTPTYQGVLCHALVGRF